MEARRGNVILQIKPEDLDFYLGKGYSIYDGDILVKQALPQTLSDYQNALRAAEARIVELEQQVADLQVKKQAKKTTTTKQQ